MNEKNASKTRLLNILFSLLLSLHSAYEGMILKGRMLANAFLSEFTSATIPSAFLDEDVARRFPWNRCPDGTLPSDGNFCWIDYRDESVITSSELCNTTSNTGGGTTDDSSATGMMVGQGLGMILGTAIGLFFFV